MCAHSLTPGKLPTQGYPERGHSPTRGNGSLKVTSRSSIHWLKRGQGLVLSQEVSLGSILVQGESPQLQTCCFEEDKLHSALWQGDFAYTLVEFDLWSVLIGWSQTLENSKVRPGAKPPGFKGWNTPGFLGLVRAGTSATGASGFLGLWALGAPLDWAGQGLSARALLSTLPGAGHPGRHCRASALGIGHLPGDKDRLRPDQDKDCRTAQHGGSMTRQSRAVRSWRLAQLWQVWDRGWWPQCAGMGSWAVGRCRDLRAAQLWPVLSYALHLLFLLHNRVVVTPVRISDARSEIFPIWSPTHTMQVEMASSAAPLQTAERRVERMCYIFIKVLWSLSSLCFGPKSAP